VLFPLASATASDHESSKPDAIGYHWPGLKLNGDWITADVKLRAQLRLTSTHIESGFTNADEDREAKVNRSRIKVGGMLITPQLDYYTEYDFPSEKLLDLRFSYKLKELPMNIRIGQWKVPYNRERIDSSGKQQFIDRSIANKWFTLDRQRGVAFYGHIAEQTSFDSTYNFAITQGTGRNGEGSSDKPQWLARWEWNFLKRATVFSQSNAAKNDVPIGSLTFGASESHGVYTAFSSAGGGQLPGFTSGDEDAYEISQYMQETYFQHQGFSWQQELHTKKVEDRRDGTETNITGGYMQAGYFPAAHWDNWPQPLEFAIRFAKVRLTESQSGDHKETSLVMNWFLSGHNNKISVDYSFGKDNTTFGNKENYQITRLQWDFHL
jgi:phosphate-selective porin OprO/OprP